MDSLLSFGGGKKKKNTSKWVGEKILLAKCFTVASSVGQGYNTFGISLLFSPSFQNFYNEHALLL
jgi:hypothetical protein